MQTPIIRGALQSNTTRNVWTAATTAATIAPIIVATLVHFVPGQLWSLDLGPIAGIDGLTVRQALVTVLTAASTGIASRALALFRRPDKAAKAERNIRARAIKNRLPG